MTKLRLAFMGTPDFAVSILEALIAAGHDIAAVYAQPPRPAGRGHRPQPSPVQRAAERAGLAVRVPLRLDEAEAAAFAALGLDAAVVAAYGLILPPAVLAAPRLGALNVHASLLPRWRGAAPIERAILAGDAETGITIMQMEAGLDTGPILLAEPMAIGSEETAPALRQRLAVLGARLIVAALEERAAGRLVARPQPAAGVTYAKKLRREEGRLDWRQGAEMLARAVRALNPSPGTWFDYGAERIKVLAARASEGSAGAAPGRVLDEHLRIQCGAGALEPLILQRAGRAPQERALFLRGFAIPPGTVLPCPAIA